MKKADSTHRKDCVLDDRLVGLVEGPEALRTEGFSRGAKAVSSYNLSLLQFLTSAFVVQRVYPYNKLKNVLGTGMFTTPFQTPSRTLVRAIALL